MRLVSDVLSGFQHKPHLRTVLASLDLTSAYNRVDHLSLLDIFCELDIPPVYARFYKGFLTDQIFRVRIGNVLSRWAKESAGVPQGSVSSPLLFVIYMESFLRHVLPTATECGITLSMFADDLNIWTTGASIPLLANKLSNFVATSVVPWCNSHNMILSPKKCRCILI